MYQMYLGELEPERVLFLAVSLESFEKFLQLPAIDFAVKKKNLKLIVFNPDTEEIVKWIN